MIENQDRASRQIYHIRIGAELDEKWADWFDGFVMASRSGGETLLSGPVADQAALHGVLAQIHRLGLPLLLVAQSGCPCSNRNCLRHGRCVECAGHYAARSREPFCLRPKSKWDKRCAVLVEPHE
jgi:hypothetical protein